MEFFLVQTLNGVSYGLLLFMLSSGLTLVKSAAKGGPKEAKIDMENSGLAPVTDARMEAFTSTVPTSCQMKRP